MIPDLPSKKGWFMPAEWAQHRRCWMAWPTGRRWGKHLDTVCHTHATLARAIAHYEPVTMVAHPAQAEDAARHCGQDVTVLGIPVDDLWIRDTGPTFLLDAHGRLAGTTWKFNAWGRKHRSFENDASSASACSRASNWNASNRHLFARVAAPSVWMERARCWTTETVALNRNRNF